MFFDDWKGLIRVLVVGILAYFALVSLLRSFGNRTLSKMNAFDFIITVALGSTLATILLSEQVALVEGVAGMTLLISLQFAVTWISVRSSRVANLVKSEPTLLAFQGRILPQQMRRARVTNDELLAAVRQQGYSSIGSVLAVVLETDGSFSVVSTSDGESDHSALANLSRNTPVETTTA
jgi:uncharacterized membrane protein YcaP (DUF421 family)